MADPRYPYHVLSRLGWGGSRGPTRGLWAQFWDGYIYHVPSASIDQFRVLAGTVEKGRAWWRSFAQTPDSVYRRRTWPPTVENVITASPGYIPDLYSSPPGPKLQPPFREAPPNPGEMTPPPLECQREDDPIPPENP